MLAFVLLTLLLAPSAQALTCFVSEGASVVERTNMEWTYCAVESTPYGDPIRFYGMTPENDYINDELFKKNIMGPIEHAVLANCVLEHYKDSLFGTSEFKVRCFCRTDDCNQLHNPNWESQIDIFAAEYSE